MPGKSGCVSSSSGGRTMKSMKPKPKPKPVSTTRPKITGWARSNK